MSFPADRMVMSEVAPDAYKAMYALSVQAGKLGVEKPLLELVKIRVSQLNRCAFCLDMHLKDARALGEDQLRLDLLPAWREAPCYSVRECAALELAEAMTLLASGDVSDDVYDVASKVFTETELAGVIMSITVINAWNRIAVTTRMHPGHYEAR